MISPHFRTPSSLVPTLHVLNIRKEAFPRVLQSHYPIPVWSETGASIKCILKQTVYNPVDDTVLSNFPQFLLRSHTLLPTEPRTINRKSLSGHSLPLDSFILPVLEMTASVVFVVQCIGHLTRWLPWRTPVAHVWSSRGTTRTTSGVTPSGS